MVQPKKHLGQHFLTDKNIARKIVSSLSPAIKNVLEIGPGTGVLTGILLAEKIANLKVIEIDRESITHLKDTYPEFSENIIAGLENTFHNSGIWVPELISWLDEVAHSDSTSEYREVEIVAIMFDLVLEKLKRLLWSLFDASKKIDGHWQNRCVELHQLIRMIPDNHYLALENYECL